MDLPPGSPWAGRALRLQHQPSAANFPAFAEQAAASIARNAGVAITYTPDDLPHIDRLIENFRAEGAGSNDMAETLWVFGSLVGEILVRSAGGRWIETPPEQLRMFGMPFLVELPAGNTCNPLGKTFKRMDNGPEDSLAYFYTVMTSPPPAQ